MKKLLFIIIAVLCMGSCSDYYYEEGHAERAYYATDSTECVIEGVWTSVAHPYNDFDHSMGPLDVMALVTEGTTYYYQWQNGGGPMAGPYVQIADKAVNIGETIRVHGMVRNIVNQEGTSFQDIVIDSIEVLQSIYQCVDTIGNVVVQGKYSAIELGLSEYIYWAHPCLHDCKYEDNSDLTTCYIDVHVNFRYDDYGRSVYLCDEHVGLDEWVEAYGTLIQGVDRYNQPYWLINMDSIRKIPTP